MKIIIALTFLFLFPLMSMAAAPAQESFEPFRAKHPRILIFSPHPDDDVLAAAAMMREMTSVIKRDPKAGLEVVYMTCGDSYGPTLQKLIAAGRAKTFVDLGKTRHSEALAALHEVGLKDSQAIFLGFPDQGLMTLLARPKHSRREYTTPPTLASKVPYAFAYKPGAAYTRANVENEIRQIITTFRPTAVFTPTLTDNHPDHRATEIFVSEALKDLKAGVKHYEFLIHWELVEDGWPQSQTDWAPPAHHIPADLSLNIAEAPMTVEEKRKIIGIHASQTAVDGPYLSNFAKQTEVFWRARPEMKDYLNSK